MYDLSNTRLDTCSMYGNIKVLGNSHFIIMASSSHTRNLSSTTTWKIRPYARKWEPETMENIKEISLILSTEPEEAPACSLDHKIPAIVFSTSGFVGNFSHDFTDESLISNFNSQWIEKYQPILKQLSQYEIINMDSDNRVHCFQEVHVSLKSHKVLGIDPSKSPNGFSTTDFKQFLATCFSLPRNSSVQLEDL